MRRLELIGRQSRPAVKIIFSKPFVACLHHLLPPLRDTSVLSRLWSTLPVLAQPDYKKDQYFITYGLHKYRPSHSNT